MTPRVSVSIINYRTAELTLACLRSAIADLAGGPAHPPVDGQIVVVDNDSGDGSAEIIESWIADHPQAPVRLVRSETNSGFPGGHNQGMAACPAEFTLLLNSDAELRPGCLAALLAAADARPSAGLLFPRLENEDGSPQVSCFRFPSPASELIRGAGSGPITRLLKGYEIPLGTDPAPEQIDWASFACVLLRRDMVDRIGPMDEGYFLYFDDTEYCLRAGRAGWEILYVPQARTLHHRGGSGPVKTLRKANRRMPPYYYASRTRFLYQSRGWLGMMGANTLWVLGRFLARLRALLGKEVPRTAEAELRDIWTNALHPLGPRRAPWE